jgi:hypothetical protein
LELARAAREPQPDEAAVLAETVGQFLDGLEDRERPIVELRLQGYTAAEIAHASAAPSTPYKEF